MTTEIERLRAQAKIAAKMLRDARRILDEKITTDRAVQDDSEARRLFDPHYDH